MPVCKDRHPAAPPPPSVAPCCLLQGTPYNDRGQLYNSRPVVYECGPWANCPDGHDCKQVRGAAACGRSAGRASSAVRSAKGALAAHVVTSALLSLRVTAPNAGSHPAPHPVPAGGLQDRHRLRLGRALPGEPLAGA